MVKFISRKIHDVGQQVTWKLWMFLISTPHKTRTFTVRLPVTTKYQGNGFAAEVLLGRSHRKRSYWEHDGMRSPKLRPSRSICRRVMAFRILSNNDRPPTFNIWSHDCHCCPNLLFYTKFHQNWFTRSASRRPYCWMSRAPLLDNGRCHGNPVLADMSRTWWDATSQVSSQ